MAYMVKNFLSLNDIKAYTTSTALSDYVWELVSTWDWFNKRTLGVQYVNAVDSIAANIAEGFGRYHKKDKQKFYYNSRGSAYESLHWVEKAKTRKLLSQQVYEHIVNELNTLPKEINWLIKITEEKLKT